MRMGQGVRTGLGHGVSPVSYRHNFLVFFFQWTVTVCHRAVMMYQLHKLHLTI